MHLQQLEATLEERWAFERYRRSLEDKGLEQLRTEALKLAELALVLQPAAMRWLLQQALEAEQRQVPPVEDWHRALAVELLGPEPSDDQAT